MTLQHLKVLDGIVNVTNDIEMMQTYSPSELLHNITCFFLTIGYIGEVCLNMH